MRLCLGRKRGVLLSGRDQGKKKGKKERKERTSQGSFGAWDGRSSDAERGEESRVIFLQAKENVLFGFFDPWHFAIFLVGGDYYDPEFAETAGISFEGNGKEADERRREDGGRTENGSSLSAGIFWEPAFTISADRRRS